MSFRIVISLSFVCCQVYCGNSPGLAAPIIAVEGDDFPLECNRTVDDAVDWKYMVNIPDIPTYLVINGRLLDHHKNKFELDSSTYSLTIRNVNVNDSGIYYCVEETGFGLQHFMRLTVENKNETNTLSTRENTNEKNNLSTTELIIVYLLLACALIGMGTVICIVCWLIRKLSSTLQENLGECWRRSTQRSDTVEAERTV